MPKTDDSTPFSISPNPNCLHLTPSLRAVTAKAKFTIDKRQGLAAILGDIGLGKSTILRYLYAEYSARDDIITTLVPTPKFPSPFATLKFISQDLGVDGKRSFVAQQDALQDALLNAYSSGKNVVVFIDEAQVLDNAQFELIRSMLNYETHKHKLIQLVLAGQLELRDKLALEKNKALYSRISTYSVLDPLTLEEADEMLAFRCKYESVQNPFTPQAIEKLYVTTRGIPRSILKVAALAYEMMLMEGSKTINADLIDDTVPEVAIDAPEPIRAAS